MAVKCLLRRTRLHFLRFYSPSSSAFMLEPEYETPNFKTPFPKTTPNLPRMVVKVIKILNWGVAREIKFKGWVQTHGFQKSINSFSIIIHTYALAGMSWEVFILLRDIVTYCKQENCDALELVSVLVDEGTSAIVFDMLIKVFASNSMLEHAYYVFVSATNVGIEPNIRCCNFLLKCLVEDNRVDGVRFLFEDLMKFGPRPNIHTYTIMMNFYCGDVGCSVDDIRRASEILGKIYRSGETPNVVTFSTYVKGLCKVGYLEVAWKLIQKLSEETSNSFALSAFSYCSLIKGFYKSRQFTNALKVFRIMEKHRMWPDTFTCNHILSIYCRKPDFNKALALLEKFHEHGVYLNPYSYNELMHRLCRESVPEKALQLLPVMLKRNVLPGVVNYSTLISCFAKRSNFKKAAMLFTRMKEVGITFNGKTYTILINLCIRNCKMRMAYDLFEEMKERRVCPDQITYTTLIAAYCNTGEMIKAREFFDEMLQENCSPNVVTYTCFINAFLKLNMSERAHKLYEKMKKTGVYPDRILYTMLIAAFCNTGEMNRAQELFDEMLGKDCSPNVVAYTCLINAYNKLNKRDQAQKLCEEMRAKGLSRIQIM